MPDLSLQNLDDEIKQIYSVILALSGIVIRIHRETMAIHSKDEEIYKKMTDEIGQQSDVLLERLNKLSKLLGYHEQR